MAVASITEREKLFIGGEWVAPATDRRFTVTLTATTTTLLDVIHGDQALPIAILAGDVRYTGPVRKFLRVVPIFQNLDFSVWRQERPPEEVEATAV